MTDIAHIIKESLKTWWLADPLSSGAAAAFYAIFSLPAVVIIVLNMLTVFVSQSTANHFILIDLERLVGIHGSQYVAGILSILEKPDSQNSASILGILGVLIGALGLFTQLETTINMMWKVTTPVHQSLYRFIYTQVSAFLIIGFLGILVAISIVFSFFAAVFGTALVHVLPVLTPFLGSFAFLQSIIIMISACAGMYAYLPQSKVSWKAVIGGSVATTFLFIIGREIISWYLSSSTIATAYGAASTIIIIMLWVYYSSQIFFFGAALTYSIDQSLSPHKV